MVQSRRNILFGFFENVNQFPSLFGITASEEAVGRARLLGTCRATNTMNVVLSIVREIKVHHKLDIMHICGEREGCKGSGIGRVAGSKGRGREEGEMYTHTHQLANGRNHTDWLTCHTLAG